MGSCVLPLSTSIPEFKPFADLYNEVHSDYFRAVSVLMSAEIDKVMYISMLKIVSTDPQYQYINRESSERIKDNIKKLEELNFKIESYKTGYRIIAI